MSTTHGVESIGSDSSMFTSTASEAQMSNSSPNGYEVDTDSILDGKDDAICIIGMGMTLSNNSDVRRPLTSSKPAAYLGMYVAQMICGSFYQRNSLARAVFLLNVSTSMASTTKMITEPA